MIAKLQRVSWQCNFDFKIFGEFLKVFESAAELSRLTGVI